MNKRRIVASAAFIYLFLAIFTFHPDIKTVFYQSQFLTKGIYNIYSFFANNPDKAYLGPFVYPPLAYYIYGLFYIPVKIIGGSGFVQWLGMGNDAVSVTHIYQYLLAVKIPALMIHFFTGFLLLRFFNDNESQKRALILWFFNPVSIYVIAFMGQIDSLAVLLTVASLLFTTKRPALSLILLGLGASVKTYPLLLIPFIAFIVGKNWAERIKYFILGLLPYIFLIAPFVKTPAFYSSAFTSGLSMRIFELKLPLGFGENIVVIPAILLLLLIASLNTKLNRINIFPFYFFVITFIIVTMSHSHPQWSLWIIPFLVITVIKNKKVFTNDKIFSLVFLFVGWLGTVILFDDKFLSWGIISPIDPGILNLPTISQYIKKFIDPSLVQSIFHTVMIISGLWLILPVLRNLIYEKNI